LYLAEPARSLLDLKSIIVLICQNLSVAMSIGGLTAQLFGLGMMTMVAQA